jgi:Cu(I)/Ag(I) efflux system membrane fusion protein
MKTKQLIIAVLILLIGIATGLYLSPASSEAVSTPADVAESTAPTVWTCSMHPHIHQTEPGDCPICGMDLIPLPADSAADDGPRTMSMSESSRALADIQTTEVQRDYPEAEIRLVGKLGYDETKVKSLTARFSARIDTLYVNYKGISVERGEHLAEVYSPELLSAQRELLSANQRDPNGRLVDLARDKLRLWDLLPEQIDAILARGVAEDHFELRAPISGVVVNQFVKEGNYIKTGEPLFRIVDLSELWLILDAYESDLNWLRFGQTVEFSVEAYPGERFTGPIIFIEPELDMKTRTVAVRVNVPNSDGRLKPGMFARGTVHSRIAEDGNVYAPDFAGKWISPMHPEIIKDAPGSCDICGMALVPAESLGYVSGLEKEAPLVVPASAVLRTGKRAVVYVEKPNTNRPTYEGREIVLGPRAGDTFLVTAGLEAGERVVTNGAFKIDSALQIQAKPSMMNPDGGGSMPGHNHGGGAPAAKAQHKGMSMLEIADDVAPKLLSPYLAMQSALASDDLDTAKAEAKAMMEITGHSGSLPEMLHDMLAAKTLDAFRIPHFETLSTALIAAARANPTVFESKLIIMYCPMANDNQGADWLQAREPLQNPYFGAMMLKCGEIKETISATQSGHENHAQ